MRSYALTLIVGALIILALGLVVRWIIIPGTISWEDEITADVFWIVTVLAIPMVVAILTSWGIDIFLAGNAANSRRSQIVSSVGAVVIMALLMAEGWVVSSTVFPNFF